MAKYQRLMDEIQQQIQAGIWLPGTRLPSLRQPVAQQGLSLMTVLHARARAGSFPGRSLATTSRRVS